MLNLLQLNFKKINLPRTDPFLDFRTPGHFFLSRFLNYFM